MVADLLFWTFGTLVFLIALGNIWRQSTKHIQPDTQRKKISRPQVLYYTILDDEPGSPVKSKASDMKLVKYNG